MSAGAPDPGVVHPIAARSAWCSSARSCGARRRGRRVHVLRRPDDPPAFERDAVLYGFGPERLIIGRFCAIASGVRFLLPGANHADLGPSTYPFGVFGDGWDARWTSSCRRRAGATRSSATTSGSGTRRWCCRACGSATVRSSRRRASSPATSRPTRSSPAIPRASPLALRGGGRRPPAAGGLVGLADRARHRARAHDHGRHARGARTDRGGARPARLVRTRGRLGRAHGEGWIEPSGDLDPVGTRRATPRAYGAGRLTTVLDRRSTRARSLGPRSARSRAARPRRAWRRVCRRETRRR